MLLKNKIKNRKIKEKMKSQKGAISIFTVLAMIFFLVAILGAFTFASRRNQAQVSSITDLKSLYKENGDEIYDSIVLGVETVIPIYGEVDYTSIGTDIIKTINGKNYTFSKASSYILKNDIKIDLEKIYTESLAIKDYTIYNTTEYKVSKSSYEVFYMHDQDGDGEKEKYILIAYNKNGKAFVSGILQEDEYCIIGNSSFEYEKYKYDDKYNFLTLEVLGANGMFYTNEYKEFPEDVEKIEAYDLISDSANSYYMFLRAESGKNEVNVPEEIVDPEDVELPYGKVYLADVAKVGDYVKYPVDYVNVPTGINTTDSYENELWKSSLTGWRVIDVDTTTKEVKLISAGTPIIGLYEYEGYSKDDYNYNDSYRNKTITVSQTVAETLVNKFSETEFLNAEWTNVIYWVDGIEPATIKGDAFLNTNYAKSVTTLNKELLEKAYGETLTVDSKIEESSSDRKYKLFANDSKYFVAGTTVRNKTESCTTGRKSYNVYFNIYTIYGIDQYDGEYAYFTTVPNTDYNRNYSNAYRKGIRPVVTLKPLITEGTVGEHGATLDDAWNIENL